MTYTVKLMLLVVAFALWGCTDRAGPAAAQDSPDASRPASRIIIKFRDAALTEQTDHELRRDAQRAGMHVTYVRALYGNVHLYQVTGAADRNSLARLMRQFAAHANVEYVEPDRILRHQSPGIRKQ